MHRGPAVYPKGFVMYFYAWLQGEISGHVNFPLLHRGFALTFCDIYYIMSYYPHGALCIWP